MKNLVHTVTMDLTQVHKSKPTQTIAKISKNLTTIVEVDMNGLAEGLTDKGYTWSPSNFGGKPRNNKNWISQSIFALDFDSGISPMAVIARLSDLNIRVNIIHTSFSDSPLNRKFRAIISLDTIVTDRAIAKFIMVNLMNVFKDEVDKACKDYARMFFGGKEVLHLDNNDNSYEIVMAALNIIQIANDRGETRKVKEVKNMGIDGIFYSIYIEDHAETQKIENPKLIENYNYEVAREQVLILSDFVNGKWLTHSELFGLATNFNWIKGGLKFMRDTMNTSNSNKTANYSPNNFAILTYVSKMNYLPQRLENFSPYKADSKHLNLLKVERFKIGRVDVVDKPHFMKIEEAEDIMAIELNKFISDTTVGERMMLAKTACALGKTQHLTTLKNVVIACENNKLKHELASRMQHCEFMVTPDFPTFNTVVFNNVLKSYYDANLGEYASKFIRKIAHNKGAVTIDGTMVAISLEDKEIALIYIAENKLINCTDLTVITTHTRALSSDFPNHDLIIFDEDPLNSILEIGNVPMDFSIFEGTKFKKDVKAIESYFNSLPLQTMNDTKTFVFNEDYHEFCITAVALGKCELIKALQSKWLLKESREVKIQGASNVDVFSINYGCQKEMPKDKNILILSATAPESIYKMLNKDLEFLNLSLVQQQGEIIQNSKRSYSRQGMKTYSSSVKTQLLKEIGNRPVLTFMKSKPMFTNPMQDLHFGKCSGADEFKGVDIAVVGTPNKPTMVYFFYAKMLGLDISTADNMIEYQLIEWKGMKFKFMTYDNISLRDIQLSLIESELIQAVGRSRTLRTNSTVLLYSNLPLQISTSIIN